MKAYSLNNTDYYYDSKECVCCAVMTGLRWERKMAFYTGNFEKSKNLICMYLIHLNSEIPTRIGLSYISGKVSFLQNFKCLKMF